MFSKLAKINSNLEIDEDEIEEINLKKNEIIFVEDSSVMANVLKDTFRKTGFNKITYFSDSKQALEYINSKSKKELEDIFCLVTDIELPKMDGITLARKIKENDKTNTLKIIIFSSIARKDTISKIKNIGVEAQVSKPNLKELLKVIKDINEEKEG